MMVLGILFYLFYIFRFFNDFPTDVAEFLDVERDVRGFWAVDEDDPDLAVATRYPRHLFFYPLYFPVRYFFSLMTESFLTGFQSLLLLHVLMGLALAAGSYLAAYRISSSRLVAFFSTAFVIISIPEFLSIRGFPTCLPDAMSWAFVPPVFLFLDELGRNHQPGKSTLMRIVKLGLVTSLMFLSSFHVINILPVVGIIVLLWLFLGRIQVPHLMLLVLVFTVSNLMISNGIYWLRWIVSMESSYSLETSQILDTAFLQSGFSYVGYVADTDSYDMSKFLDRDHFAFRFAKLFDEMKLYHSLPFIQIPGSPYYSFSILPLLTVGLLNGVWTKRRSAILVAVGFITLIVANNFSPRNGLWSHHLAFFSFPLYLGAGQGLFALRNIFDSTKLKGFGWLLLVVLFLGGAVIQNYSILQVKMYRSHHMIGDGWRELLLDYYEYVGDDKKKPLILVHSFWRRLAFDFYNKKEPPNYRFWADIPLSSLDEIFDRMNDILKKERKRGQEFILLSNSKQFVHVESAYNLFAGIIPKKWLVKEHISPRNSKRILWELYKIPTTEVFDTSKFLRTNIERGNLSDQLLLTKYGFEAHSFRLSPISLLSASREVKFERVVKGPAPLEGKKAKNVLEIGNQGENLGFFWFDSTIPPERMELGDIYEVTLVLSSETTFDMKVLNWRTLKGIDIKVTPERKKYTLVVRNEGEDRSTELLQNRLKIEFHVPKKTIITFHDYSINRYKLMDEK